MKTNQSYSRFNNGPQGHLGSNFGAFLRSKSLLSIIVIVCSVLWVVTLTFPIVDYLMVRPHGWTSGTMMKWLALSSEGGDLLTHPWTLVTYLFLHHGLLHWLFSMIMLYVAGTMCYRYLGSRRFAWLFFLCGLAGALFYLLICSIFPIGRYSTSYAIGASTAALGVFTAVAFYAPNQEIGFWLVRTFNVKMKWIAVAFIVLDLLFIPVSNAGGHIAHLGGMLCGLLYVVVMRSRNWQPLFQHAGKGPRIRKQRTTRSQQSNGASEASTMDDGEYNRRKHEEQARVDAILDKISKSGYDNLSKEDKEFLFHYKAH